ncbi:PREDICTED: S-(+)-linalool synthase, chloroplastic-like [Tarenaya hassleriana]|uniref:S-(+)-linalool synthase, chloroplastic-like n=1 Tax=Tarenaya hassleriana TaxID=28532 RepID=UPI00053C655F|nr:PREDICTED: S-(+)-linalool synthase, chloroplastic-like [Tarenaya hassleriana]
MESSKTLLICPTRDHTSAASTEHESNIMRLRNMLTAKGEDPFEAMEIIDAIQRLCIDHHFRYEMEEILQKLYQQCSRYQYYGHGLREVALCFRLLRQAGHHVSAENAFSGIRDENGRFRGEFQYDVEGLIELFEASQLSTEGEKTLEDGRDFAVNQLTKLCSAEESHRGRVIMNVLNQPSHKSLSRLTVNRFISMTSDDGENKWLQPLLQVAKIDFDMLKALHQDEISKTLKWWRELSLTKELKKARDQPLKWYTWSMAVLQDPGLSEIRLDLVKPISFVYIIDDIFDIYGGIDELTIFTQVMERWDRDEDNLVEKLPNYMKVCLEALDVVTMEISLKVHKKHGWNPINSLRKSWARLFKAFLVEAKWFESGYLPSKEEYIENGRVSSGVPLVLLHLFFMLGEETTKEKVQLTDESNPLIVSSAATILRLCDDFGSAKDENQDEYDGSYMECYMKQHQGSTIEEARAHSLQMISNAWKRLNEECLDPNPFSGSSFAKACLNVARTVPLMYTYDDDHRLPGLDDYLKSLMLDHA